MHPVDHRLEMPPPFVRRALQQTVEGAQVAARHEVAAGALQHHHARVPVALYGGQRTDQGFAELVVERVQHVGPVEGHPGDAAFSLDLHRIAHAAFLLLMWPPPARVLPSCGAVGETAPPHIE